MTKVYVPNVPMRRDPDSGAWRPSIGLHPAEKHGELVYLFSQDEVMAGAAPCDAVIDKRLAAATAEDCVLFVGDPAIMALVIRAHARLLPRERLNLLKWDRFARDYLKISIR
jgi:hypothetical protein